MGKDQSTTHKHSNNFAFVLVAAAAGAIAGLLFAPKKGIETREDLKVKYNETKNKTQDAAETAREKASKSYESVRNKVHGAADESKDAVDESVDKAAAKAKSPASKVSDEAKKAASTTDERSGRDHAAM